MVNRSIAKRAKHAKPALRQGYGKKSGSSVLAVALAASLIPVAPALGDERDTTISSADVEEVSNASESSTPSNDTPSEVPADSEEPPVLPDPTVADEPPDTANDSSAGDDAPPSAEENDGGAAQMQDYAEPVVEPSIVAEDSENKKEEEEELVQSWRITDGVPNNVLLEQNEAAGITPFGAYSDVEDGYRSTWSKSDGVGQYSYRANPGDSFQKIKVPGAKEVGVDISYYNNESGGTYKAIDWAKMKADGITFAIIRIGDGGSNGKFFVDPWFKRNIQGARASGIKVGVYVYSRARYLTGSTYSVSNEVEATLAQLKAAGISPSDLALPVYLDMEDASQRKLSAEMLGKIATSYCNAIRSEGYKVGIYANQDWFNNVLTADAFSADSMKRSGWSRWVARYSWGSSSSGVANTDIWQFTSIGTVSGQYRKYCDVNFSFVAFDAAPTGTPNTWEHVNGHTYYYGSDGKAVKWSQKIEGSWYYFDGLSRMVEGWVTWNADGTKSYFEPGSGKARVGWQTIGGKRYYFSPATGRSLRWRQHIDGYLFYFNGASVMQSGWIIWSEDGRKSYFEPSTGRAASGWQTIAGKRYYFDSTTGKALVGTHIIDGEKYLFGNDAALINGDSTIEYEPTGVSLNTMAKKELDSCPTSLGYTQSQITNSMNPSTYATSSRQFYQFAQLNKGYSGLFSADQLNAFIASTAKGRSGALMGTGQYFIDAARLYGVNEVYLLAHAIVESGWGTSTLAKGYAYDGKTAVAGKVWPKGTYYNFYGIGAYDSSPLSGGRAMAIKQGWNSREKAIAGAARWIADNYLSNSHGQNTLYKMRWNYMSFSRYGKIEHQYATDRQWATTIGGVMSDIYTSVGINQKKSTLTFLVPTYL